MKQADDHSTHFGFKKVLINEKEKLVEGVFRSVAPNYDVMNDIMSFGLHRFWKKLAIHFSSIKKGDVVLDVASGTGDLVQQLIPLVGKKGKVIASDINEAMLTRGRARLIDKGLLGRFSSIIADAEQLPFITHTFDCVTIAFGLRNVTDKESSLASMYRVLKPGGKLMILEFSHPQSKFIKKLYDQYSFKFIPKLGEWIAHDKESYQYLIESIRMHPKQEQLKEMMLSVGFEDVDYVNITGGIVALHTGFKY